MRFPLFWTHNFPPVYLAVITGRMLAIGKVSAPSRGTCSSHWTHNDPYHGGQHKTPPISPVSDQWTRLFMVRSPLWGENRHAGRRLREPLCAASGEQPFESEGGNVTCWCSLGMTTSFRVLGMHRWGFPQGKPQVGFSWSLSISHSLLSPSKLTVWSTNLPHFLSSWA